MMIFGSSTSFIGKSRLSNWQGYINPSLFNREPRCWPHEVLSTVGLTTQFRLPDSPLISAAHAHVSTPPIQLQSSLSLSLVCGIGSSTIWFKLRPGSWVRFGHNIALYRAFETLSSSLYFYSDGMINVHQTLNREQDRSSRAIDRWNLIGGLLAQCQSRATDVYEGRVHGQIHRRCTPNQNRLRSLKDSLTNL
ncbi:hypothetical protein PM082_004499 [Marasmius tenuissimus]|nr:hypothetical protein PM082_004499 [Marasmius tenuissimus]